MSGFALNAAPFLKEEIIETKRPLMSVDEISGKLKEKTKQNTDTIISLDNIDDNDSEYADFEETESGELNKTNNIKDAYAYENVGFFEDKFKNIAKVTTEGFDNKSSNNSDVLNNEHNNLDNSRQIEKKLNYLIQILELQKDQRTEYVSEEIILYMFLGIFIVHTIDSFIRVGKYTR